jgi:hypothetical protein
MWRLYVFFIKHKTTILDRLKKTIHLKSKPFSCLLLFFLAVTSCTEPYALQTNAYEEAIVIEATITNELKNQEIKVSKTYRFEENGPTFESGAIVFLTDDLGNQYDFEEKDGKYVSKIIFQAAQDRAYRLKVMTKDGESYTSRSETLTTANELESLSTNITTKENEEGVEIIANCFDPNGKSRYYRYEYEETYKVIAPKWVTNEAIVYLNTQTQSKEIFLQPRTTEVRTCYSSKKSDKIILNNTNNLSEDRVNFPVRFIKSSDYIIMNRYSILAKQYVQNLAAYTYYQTLEELSDSESLLSQNQPGFLSGNIKSDNNPNRKVIGYFEVASYSEKRLFFNFSDVFPGEEKPKYPYNCPDIKNQAEKQDYNLAYCYDIFNKACQGSSIVFTLENKINVYYGGWNLLGNIPISPDTIIELYPIQCGDCTSFSSNIKPLFWID